MNQKTSNPILLNATSMPAEVSSPKARGHRASSAPLPAGEEPASHAVRILCVDDHDVLIEGLRAHFAVKGQLEVVGHLSNASRLVEEVRKVKPSAVLLDIEMPGPDAFEAASRLRQVCPAVRVMVLSAHIRDAFISAAFAAGVSGYFAKSEALDDIVQGVLEVMKNRPGTFILGPKVRERCRPMGHGVHKEDAPQTPQGGAISMRKGAPDTRLASLTPREAEILRLVGKGLSRMQIADQICRSVKTVDGHQDRMMKKLGIGRRADLMRFAIREGLAQA